MAKTKQNVAPKESKKRQNTKHGLKETGLTQLPDGVCGICSDEQQVSLFSFMALTTHLLGSTSFMR
jgi:hypothetical protein